MAFQIDPNIPLQAGKVQFDPASILMQAQQNGLALEKHRFEMQKLREDYDLAKEKRKQEKAMQMGIASDLAGIQSGTPAQYAPTRFEQTPQRGQMPQGMTGVMMREQGQQMPQPQAFGEEILNGDFRLGGGEVTQEAVAGRQPTYPEMLAIGLKQAMLTKNQDEIFKYAKAIQETEKQATKWGMNPTKGINEKGQPDYFVVNELGQKQFLGVNPYETPKDVKVTPVTRNGQPVTVKVPGTNEVKILMSDGTYSSGGSIPIVKPERPEQYFPDDGLTGEAFLSTLPKQMQNRIIAIATSRAKFPSYTAMRRDPTLAKIVEGVYKAFPEYDETQFGIRQGAGKAFAYGKQGDKLRSFGTAQQHIETLLDIAKGLQTGDLKRVNYVANLFGKETGYAPPITFEAVQQLVADEILASIVPGAGGVEERLQLAKKLTGNTSYAVLTEVIGRFQEMMAAQGSNLRKQAEYGGVDVSKMPDYAAHDDSGHGGGGGGDKDPYKITKDTDPRRARYLMNHKRLVEAKDYEGANMLTDMYNKGAK